MSFGLRVWVLAGAFVLIGQITGLIGVATAGEFSAPWRDKTRPIILDAYEKNPIDWHKVVTNKQIFGFIGKSSDGLPPRWGCRKPNRTEQTLCKKTFQNYWLKKELYQTRRLVAKSLGLKWGAYHLGRPGNPIDQANHFIDFTQPDDDDLLALDIEHDNPKKWISLKDAEIFVKHVKYRTGRYPILYTNHDTAKRIAARRAELPTLSRLPLWYARYRSNITGAFPMGHWDTYAIWQFSAHPNCNKRRCLYRVAGTKTDIDVNVGSMSAKELEKAWPFGGLVPKRDAPEKNDPNILMVSAETTPITASIVSTGRKKTITRFKMNLEIEDIEGESITLTSVAVPSPRSHVANELGFEVAALDAKDAIAALPVRLNDGSAKPEGKNTSNEQKPTSVSVVKSEKADVKTIAVKPVVTAALNRPKASYGYSNKSGFAAGLSSKAR